MCGVGPTNQNNKRQVAQGSNSMIPNGIGGCRWNPDLCAFQPHPAILQLANLEPGQHDTPRTEALRFEKIQVRILESAG